jgi:hypothetical protein
MEAGSTFEGDPSKGIFGIVESVSGPCLGVGAGV